MSLDALLARLKSQSVTSVTSGVLPDVTPKLAPHKAVTPVTFVTSENAEGNSQEKLEGRFVTPDETVGITPKLAPHKAVTPVTPVSETEVEDLREYFEERAGILEYDAGLPRPEAEFEAACITATYARNSGYQWSAFRLAFEPYPDILAMLPDKDGSVDALPLGVAKVAVAGRRVMRQCTFVGAQTISSPKPSGQGQ